jgi:hypothetical protein
MKSANCGEVNYATLAAAYRNLFPDFICRSITIAHAQQIKSLVHTQVYYFVYSYDSFIFYYLFIKTVRHFFLLF